MAWDEERGLGAIIVPNPKTIHPKIDRVNMFGRFVKNPGYYREGDIVVITDRIAYDQFVAAGWAPALLVP
jgi:hypothetical protein